MNHNSFRKLKIDYFLNNNYHQTFQMCALKVKLKDNLQVNKCLKVINPQ